MVHAGKENLPCTSVGNLFRPFEESAFSSFAPSFHITMPPVIIQSCIDGTYTHLTAELVCNLVDELWVAQCSTVYADFVGTRMQQSFDIFQFVDAATNSKRNVDFPCHPLNHLSESLPSFKRGGNVEEHQFVGTSVAVCLSQFNRVSRTSQVDKVRTLYGFAILDVETGNDALCQSSWQQLVGVDTSFVISFSKYHGRNASCIQCGNVLR